jgi:hypothetical protein
MGENYHGLVGSVSNSGGGGDFIFSFWGHLHCQIPISLSHTSDKEKQILLSEEVQSLILKGAIERIHDPFQSPGFYSRLFLVPMKTEGMRPVIDLSILNMFLLVPHFKMETLVCGQQASISWMRTFTSLLFLPSENVFVLFGTIQYTNFDHSHSGSQRLL